VEVIKTITAIQDIVISGEDLTPETRLLTGADNKHIRFADIFDGSELMDQKWDLISGTATVTDKYCDLEDAVTDTITSDTTTCSNTVFYRPWSTWKILMQQTKVFICSTVQLHLLLGMTFQDQISSQ